jgi:hypothetical protein
MATRKNKKSSSSPPLESAFSGVQLSLFQNFLCNTEEERDRLSNTIELWDGVPKYFVSRKDMNGLRENGFLPTLERDFQYGGKGFTVKIRPGRIADEGGKDKEFYPSAREELVEDALRKIGAEQNFGFFEEKPQNRRSGVMFSLHMLRKELARRGHTLSYQQVMESLHILSDTSVEICASNGTSIFKSAILPTLAAVSRVKLSEDPSARWYVDFCPLVTESIRALNYRQYDYHAMMAHVSQLTRWLNKRLSHNYSNAHVMHPYSIRFSTIQGDSGLLEYKETRRAVRKLEDSFKELQQQHILLSFEKETERGSRNRILDVKYILTPDPDFVKHVKAANKRLSEGRKTLQAIEKM